MAGGINPKAQPLYDCLGKVFKCLYIDNYDNYMLYEPPNDRGHIFPSWVVKARNKSPEELVRKSWSWEVCGYKNIDDLQNVEGSINQSIAEFDRARIVQIMEYDGGPEAITSLYDTENDIDDTYTEYPPEGTWDITAKS